jgi:PAS domain S-box-containing protein
MPEKLFDSSNLASTQDSVPELVLHHDPVAVKIVTEVRREQALLKAGALQSAIFNSANFSSIATDAKGVIQIFNVGAERMLGYTAHEVVNKITPADISDPQEVIARAAELTRELGTPITPGFEALVFKASRGIEDIYELTYIRKDGSRFPAVVSVTALRDAQDGIIGYLLIGTDNTARKQAEEALHENYALLRTIHLHSIVSVTDQAGRIVDANEGFCKISGYRRDELIGQTHRIVNSGVQSREFWAGMWQTITAGKSWRGEICNRTKEGALYWVDSIIAPFMSEDGHTKGYISVRTDITARKQAEEGLLKAGALQNAIFNSANFSSIATDAKGVIQIFNVGAEQMLGYTADEVVNKITPADISDPQEVIVRAEALSVELETPIAPGFEALVFKASRGIEDIYELTYFRKDGSRFPAVVSVTALRDAQDAIIGYLLIATDNTARIQAEEARARFFALSRDLFCTIGFDGYFKDLNPAWEKTLGYTRAELLAVPFVEFIHPDDQQATTTEADKISAGNTLIAFENRYRCKDGSYRTFLWTATPDIGNQLMYGAARDVTEAKEAEEELLKAGALQSAIFNSANFSSIATDAKGVIQIFNVGAERMLGYTADEVVNKITPADISDPQEVIVRAEALSVELGTPITPGFEALVFKASRGIEDIYELTYFRKDGSRFPAVVSVTALRDAQDAIIGYLLIGTDNTARKQAEEALLKAGALQSAIFNSANFSSIATDAKGVIQIFNVGAERMLGYTADEVVNKITPADISDPQEVIVRAEALSVELGTPIAPGFEALVFKASRGIEDIYELTYFRKDGSRFPAVVSVTALRDAQDAIIGYLLIGTDNTARKQAEEALLKAGALQSAIFNSANFSSIATDAKGVIQIFNVGAERMLGYTADEVMNKITPADISDPQEVIVRAKALSAELGTPIAPGFEALVFKASRGIEDIYELTYFRKDGSRFPAVVSVTALRDAQGGIIGYLLIGTDNTARQEVEAERKKLDQRLRDQQFYTRSLIESNIDALMTTDPLGIITDVNKQMEALTDCTRDELIGAPFKNYFTDPDRAEAGIRLVLDEKKVTNYELTACSRDGKQTDVSYNATTFYDRDRKLQGVFAAARDVTERKRFEQTLQEKNIELESANLAKDRFLASMSHELRTPLNAIIGFTGTLLMKLPGPLNGDQEQQLSTVQGSARHLLSLINDLLDLAKIESGKVEIKYEPIVCQSVVEEVAAALRPLAQNKGLDFQVKAPKGSVRVESDRRILSQILINLTNNAIKFTDKGKVRIELGTRPVNGHSLATIDVIDTGVGIRPEDKAKLFQAFQQVDIDHRAEGTGLGLYLSQKLAVLIKGRIELESEYGKGSVFRLLIPKD